MPQLIVCYLAKQSCPDYAQIKQFGDVEHGVATQCMLIEKVKTKGNNAYYSNVALKINPKLAGINQILDSGALQGFDDVPSMIFGADVTHPPPDSRDPSVSALVGSMDRYAATYGTTTRIQSSRQENIEGLEDMCLDLLKMFEVKNKRKPQRIIVFRDGVSEGQFQIVLRKGTDPVECSAAFLMLVHRGVCFPCCLAKVQRRICSHQDHLHCCCQET